MSKARLVLSCVTLVILIVSVLAACAPAAPAKPAATTPPAASIKTSYAAKTYTNDQYGFSFQYPASMTVAEKPKGTYNVFEAADSMGVPVANVGIYDTDKLETEAGVNTESTGGSDLKAVSSKDVTLADGKTKAKLQESSCKASGYDLTIISMAVDMPGGKTVSVAYCSLKDMIDLNVAKEVVSTLVLTK